jgi:peroxiredoxin
MLADGNGQFASALGVELDLTDKGLGVRSRRYALLAEDQVSAAVPSSSQLLQL